MWRPARWSATSSPEARSYPWSPAATSTLEPDGRAPAQILTRLEPPAQAEGGAAGGGAEDEELTLAARVFGVGEQHDAGDGHQAAADEADAAHELGPLGVAIERLLGLAVAALADGHRGARGAAGRRGRWSCWPSCSRSGRG